MTMEQRNQFVRVLLRNGVGQILVVADKRKGKKGWNLPGGKVEVGENPECAARREMLEETGLSLGDLRLMHEDQFRLGDVVWHGYFFEAEPVILQPSNLEPHKLSKVEFVDLPAAVAHGSKPFLVSILQRSPRDEICELPWQMQLRLESVFQKHFSDSAWETGSDDRT